MSEEEPVEQVEREIAPPPLPDDMVEIVSTSLTNQQMAAVEVEATTMAMGAEVPGSRSDPGN